MTQDTRKDRRAKIVSLNVRYKSATVDEFIENHSHDVSKGGIFIKTPTPFPPGTLLKFEIRIAGDKAVIAGVGRVVWKREPTQASGEMPAGMGVKFIKLDDSSRTVIDRLVDTKGADAGAAFESGNTEIAAEGTPGHETASPAPHMKAAAASAGTASPFDPSPSASLAAAAKVEPPPEPAPRAPAFSPRRGAAGTIMGVGGAGGALLGGPSRGAAGVSVPKPGGAAETVAKPAPTASTSPMFPKTNSKAEMPPVGEQTVMKQAAELLEEALKGAGGSMEEIGTNPLFENAAKGPTTTSHVTESKPAKIEEPPTAREAFAAPADPLPAPGRASSTPPGATTTRREPSMRRESAPPRSGPGVRSVPPNRIVIAAPVSEPPAPKRSNRGLIGLIAAAAVAGGGYFAFTQLYDGGAPPPEPTTPVTVIAPPPTIPAVSATPPASATAAPDTSASAAPTLPSASASASASPSASSAPVVLAPKPAVVAPRPPVVRTAPVAPPPTAAPADTSTGAAAPTGAAPTDTAAATPTAKAPKAPPAPKPKPKASDDDNPY